MSSSGKDNMIIPLILGGGILASALAGFALSSSQPEKEQPEEVQTVGEEVIANIDDVLTYFAYIIESAGYGIVELYNNFKNLVLKYAPELKDTLDTLGKSIQSAIDNILVVLTEAGVYSIKYGIKIPYELVINFIGPIIIDIGKALVSFIESLASISFGILPFTAPPLYGVADTLRSAIGMPPGVDAMTYAD